MYFAPAVSRVREYILEQFRNGMRQGELNQYEVSISAI